MVVVMHMQKRYKQALQFSGAILALVSIITVTLGTGFDSQIRLFDFRAQLGTGGLVAGGFRRDDLDAFLRGFNIGHGHTSSAKAVVCKSRTS